ncbi:MAG TPA: hypothetical protein VGK06_05690 [Methanosarcina sp.]
MVGAVAVIPDGKYAVSASRDRTLKIWNLEKGKQKTALRGYEKEVNKVIITQDGKYAISVSSDDTLKVWSLEQGVIISKFIGDSSFRTCDISPDGKYIVVDDALGKVHFYILTSQIRYLNK